MYGFVMAIHMQAPRVWNHVRVQDSSISNMSCVCYMKAALHWWYNQVSRSIPHVAIISSKILNQYLLIYGASTDIPLHAPKLAEQK